MLTKEEILYFFSLNKEMFKEKYNVIKLGIFGSFARDEQNETSDIDILIEMELDTEEIFEKKQEIKKILKQKYNREIDLCRERSIKPIFKTFILNEVIYV
ncbi:MAG: nucleotidyltransferase domain-containing protein [Bacteroidales bacterium]|nr:nucleotidyltransferase domain-containing protein [Bacteroidales bacterium]